MQGRLRFKNLCKTLSRAAAQQAPNKPVLGFRKYITGREKGTALLSYLPAPVNEDLVGQDEIMFSNRGIARSIPQALNELGYVVDVIYWEDKEFNPHSKYDIVIFHGGKNFDTIYPRLIGTPKIIYFGSGSYWKFSNRAEDKRLKDFERRHNVRLPRDRFVFESESAVNKVASGIIVLGDDSMRETFPKDLNCILTINNASYPDGHFDKAEKDYSQAKNNFLFFAGDGNIHKGLDLVLEAFDGQAQHLYIMTNIQPEILEIYSDIFQKSNIHNVGSVPMRSQLFYEIIDKCAFAILPSCSEGQAGSIVEAMNQGLIPIVSKETRLDVKNFGVLLKNCSVNEIRSNVVSMASMDEEFIEKCAYLTRQSAIKDHSPKEFINSFKSHIETILAYPEAAR